MKNQKQNKNKIDIKLVISFTLHVVSIVTIAVLINQVHLLQTETEFLNKQSLQFNGRTNNLEGCWKNQDFDCPENKYFDASQFMQD